MKRLPLVGFLISAFALGVSPSAGAVVTRGDCACARGNPKGMLLLSFDDRNFDAWVAALPVFDRYGAHATFFVSGEIDDDAVRNIRLLRAHGHTVGLHGLRHANAVDAIAQKGAEGYFDDDIAQQAHPCGVNGIPIRSFAYPNCQRDEAADRLLFSHGFERVRGGVPGATPYDPTGVKQKDRKPLVTNEKVFFPAGDAPRRRLIDTIIMGEAYHTDIGEILDCLRRAARNREVISITSHGISPNATGIHMKTAWLEQMLKTARELDLDVLGFDEIPPPARGDAAPCDTREPNIRIGVLSDVHLGVKNADMARILRKALVHCDERRADGVIVCGDLTQDGTIPQLQAFADVWYSVFPNDRRRDGGHVEKLFAYGDHDTENFFKKDTWQVTADDPNLGWLRKIDIASNDRAVQWKKAFHEEFAPIVRKNVKGYDFVLAHLVNIVGEPGMGYGEPLHIPGLEEFFATNTFARSKPFFYVQHKIPRGTAGGPSITGQDSGRTTAVLSHYPNAVAFCGHKHRGAQAEYSLWQGAFTSLVAPALYRVQTYAGRENGWCSCDRGDSTPPCQMPTLDTVADGSQMLVMSVYDDCIVLERRNVAVAGEVAPPWVVPLPVQGANPSMSFANRARRAVAPQFPSNAHVAVSERKGCNRAGRPTDQVVVSFPPARSTATTPRAYDYEVRVRVGKQYVRRVACAKRVYSAKCCLPEHADTNDVVCVFAKGEIPSDHDAVTFEVVPMGPFGHAGEAIAAESVTYNHSPVICPF